MPTLAAKRRMIGRRDEPAKKHRGMKVTFVIQTFRSKRRRLMPGDREAAPTGSRALKTAEAIVGRMPLPRLTTVSSVEAHEAAFRICGSKFHIRTRAVMSAAIASASPMKLIGPS